MKLTEDQGAHITLDITRDELTVLAGGLLTALDLLTRADAAEDLRLHLEAEFHGRVGVSRASATALLTELVGIIQAGEDAAQAPLA
ncbi:hypothetical protein [Deinococcus radiodurans]|jgi:hypothetical protein|uniref:Uncharacterized protein n=1 Tax=Deinococcus radiodurans (strain ATCC 13939 / DSM 20539 / JCM 16871 / CCUG 27074 / LMG 4051 / NBRC 15346 / NCIMB 9279 / VKM B-1422 / R1) TaxID=243230 RepID=Q9RVF0_DEIRA|nr:hypothetical protein [Deinococcus radiodurans]AAF10659.1 hypothetical protein DR_1079 [Deinococcus radiodurans R1 = ATCC 13939 = DSM 20539]ANC71740.1 hypothetical protein A2G07_08125 [Deinococcus radiodurans R1 = ATCC 13939 = DSM 20539]QEM70563.1 hypothetical protein DXG80_01520 [Deinococcus radiodurans]QIP29170.1 hypothetical protein HAV23_08325 [Deinococcus radiodurans]QIP32134.1 hypothetical protein HAV35_08470 [Deinococcus radiodurans]